MSVILVIDDQVDVRMSASIALANHGFTCLEADSPHQGVKQLKSQHVDLILLDMNFSLDTTSGDEGLNFLRLLKEQFSQIPVVMMTGWASVDIAVQTMQLGAADFIEKPWKNTRLVSIVKQQLQSAELHQENARYTALNHSVHVEGFVSSPEMSSLLRKAQRAAMSDANILITGENGTGKSLLAKYIHQHSARADNRFVSVNMGAIPESLFESELFGHKKGAFTDAKENRLGRFDIASKGTLFLDEIGTLPQALQAKMLRVLETGEYEIVGSSHTSQTDARILSATNADLDALIAKDNFRRDLLFRLNTVELHIPPLRERPDDILILAKHMLAKHAQKYKREGMSLATEAKAAMVKHTWLGNVRELSHCIERAVIMSDDNCLDTLSLGLSQYNAQQATSSPLMTLEESEKQAIIQALRYYDGNVMVAGEYLGLSKSAFYRRLEKFDLDPKELEK
ncbi:sigma-54-dependent transcriptional regulator [Thalassotalea atypica]|uniref:sigma-54-dependent transcriptional regulator n=1 Tax=Thalassotalea atypica TaxID=2054316 RepID=UPI00257267CB|nr:sigma-54 dependent transcriptional regulator [Thalassotalea atypica]